MSGLNDFSETAIVVVHGEYFGLSAPDPATLQMALEGLPREWAVAATDVRSDRVGVSFALEPERNGYRLHGPHGPEQFSVDRELAVSMLQTRMVRDVGAQTPGAVCVRAGAVVFRGAGILLPTQALTGTSTLVDALVGAGCEFYSDASAMIDPAGLVMWRDDQGGETNPTDAQTGVDARPSVPIGLVAVTEYEPGSNWDPRRLSAGEGIAALMAFTGARERPAKTLSTFRQALDSAEVLQGVRGEAAAMVPALLDTVSAATPKVKDS